MRAVTGLERCVACTCALLLTACGTLQAYSGPPLPRAQVARITPAATGRVRVLLLAADGYEPGLLDEGVELTPGRHELRLLLIFDARGRSFSARRAVVFDAEAGGDYTVHGDWFLHGPRVRVVARDGALVAETVTPRASSRGRRAARR